MKRIVYIDHERMLPLAAVRSGGFATVVRVKRSHIPRIVHVDFGSGRDKVYLQFVYDVFCGSHQHPETVGSVEISFDKNGRLASACLPIAGYIESVIDVCRWLEERSCTLNDECDRVHAKMILDVFKSNHGDFFTPAQ